MNKYTHFSVYFLLSMAQVNAVHARGIVPFKWKLEPNIAIEACEADTAPASYADRCSDLLFVYSRELLKCPVEAADIASQLAFRACASSAARNAVAVVK